MFSIPEETKRAAKPFVAAALGACFFGALLSGGSDPRPASAEGGFVAIASAALGPFGAAAPYAPPVASLNSLDGVPFRDGEAIDETFRLAFAACDRSNEFRGHPVSAPHCADEPNRFAAFVRLEGGAVFMQAHLGLDLSASAALCDGVPQADCAPFFDFASAPSNAYEDLGARWEELFPVSDEVALIAVPLRSGGGDPKEARAFAALSGVSIGDVGVVIYRDKVVPVMVYDGAPRHRALSGSLGLFEQIGVSRCREWRETKAGARRCAAMKEYGLGAPVIAILFPSSAPEGLTPDNIETRIRAEALTRFERLRKR